MFVITLATSKGGAGKSTLCLNLAAYFMVNHKKVSIIDADPQGSIVEAHNPEGPMANITVLAHAEEGLEHIIEELRPKYDYIFIDTGGFRSVVSATAIFHSDLVIIPTTPSAYDARMSLETVDLIRELNETVERRVKPIKYRVILSISQPNILIGKHIRRDLESAGVDIMKAEMHQRVAYREASITGVSPLISEPEGPSARDIQRIAVEIKEVLTNEQ